MLIFNKSFSSLFILASMMKLAKIEFTFEKNEPHSSGALYHLVATSSCILQKYNIRGVLSITAIRVSNYKYIVELIIHTVQNNVVGVSLNATLANPKSHILSLQFAFARIFFGSKSR